MKNNYRSMFFSFFSNKKATLFFSLLFYLITFILLRIDFYSNIGIIYVFDDGSDYTNNLLPIFNNQFPTFADRSVGYPLFIFLSYILSDSIEFIGYLQSFATILSVFTLIIVFNKYYPKLTIPAMLALCIFTNSTVAFHHETAVLSENLTTNLYLLLSASIIWAFKSSKNYPWLFPGSIMIFCIYTRPANIFLYSIFALILLYLFINRHSLRKKIYYIASFTFFYLLSATYNYFTIDEFTIKEAHGKDFLNFVHPAVTYLEKSAEYPNQVNRLIDKALANIPPQDMEIVNNSWNVGKLRVVYIRNKSNFENFRDSLYQIPDFKKDVSKVGLNSILKNPDKYFKWFYTMFFHYHRSLDPEKRVTYPFLKNYNTCMLARSRRYFYDTRFDINKRGRFLFFSSGRYTTNEMNNKIELINNKVFNQNFSKIFNEIFCNMFWVILYFTVYLICIIVLIKHKFRHIDCLIIFFILSVNIISASTFALVHGTFVRYAYVTSYSFYLAAVFIPLFIPNNLRFRSSKKKKKRSKINRNQGNRKKSKK